MTTLNSFSRFEEGKASGGIEKINDIPLQRLNRVFSVQDINVEVTSVDIASHGYFLIAGCSSGVVLLFDLSNPNEQMGGTLIGHIRAKGLHTNLLMTIKITEDSRFCFAGVMKGSSEMLAIDIGGLETSWGKKTLGVVSESPAGIAETFSHADPKLRGFGTATRFIDSGRVDADIAGPVYRLACGRGIKNVHIWQFTPPLGSDSARQARWTCIYDVATNGNTITTTMFRKGGSELLSKSAGVNVRLWDLRCFGHASAPARPSYEDIANSQDVKCLLPGGFAYGGTYEFAVVKIDAPREANRDALEMPERAGQLEDADALYSAGLRRRRTMREVEDVLSSEDGRHVLILCADGGVMYFQQATSSLKRGCSSSGNEAVAAEATPQLVELSGVQRDPATDQAWAVRRIGHGDGSQGRVVLLRATKTQGPAGSSVSIALHLLSDMAAAQGGADDDDDSVAVAVRADPDLPRQAGGHKRSGISTTSPPTAAAAASKRPRAAAVGGTQPECSRGGRGASLLSTPAASTAEDGAINRVTPSYVSMMRLADTSSVAAAGTPCKSPSTSAATHSTKRHQQARKSHAAANPESLRDNNVAVAPDAARAIAVSPLLLWPAPQVARMAESTAVYSARAGLTAACRPTTCDDEPAQMRSASAIAEMLQSWKTAALADAPIASRDRAAGNANKGCRLRTVLREQQRLRSQFIAAVIEHARAQSLGGLGGCRPVCDLSPVLSVFRSAVSEMLLRQTLELRGACAMDAIVAPPRCEADGAVGNNCAPLLLSEPFHWAAVFERAGELQTMLNAQ